MQRLPHDVLAEVLRRLETAPRHLAASRCVCKAWRAIIDAQGLLRPDLLPLCLSGLFTHPKDETLPNYFALSHQPSTEIPAAFDYLDTNQVESLMVAQHCNGLLLLGGAERRVLNPATRQWACLPSPPPLHLFGPNDLYGYKYLDEHEEGFLAFDPAVSPHYQVLLINSVPFRSHTGVHAVRGSTMALEWPPSSYTLRVFSSKTRLWEKKQIVRKGEARGRIRDMLRTRNPHYCYAAYWNGALYVHQCDFVMRINLSSYTYQVIRLPEGDLEEFCGQYYYLGKSNGGVYCAMFKGYSGFGLQVWFLDETCGQMKWALKRDINLRPLLVNFPSNHGASPMTIQYAHPNEADLRKIARHTLSILGFHPYEEIIFIHTPSKKVMAYQFNSSEAQDLGMGYLPRDNFHRQRLRRSFPYTPCRTGEL